MLEHDMWCGLKKKKKKKRNLKTCLEGFAA